MFQILWVIQFNQKWIMNSKWCVFSNGFLEAFVLGGLVHDPRYFNTFQRFSNIFQDIQIYYINSQYISRCTNTLHKFQFHWSPQSDLDVSGCLVHNFANFSRIISSGETRKQLWQFMFPLTHPLILSSCHPSQNLQMFPDLNSKIGNLEKNRNHFIPRYTKYLSNMTFNSFNSSSLKPPFCR